MAKDKKRLEIAHNITKKHWIAYSLLILAPTIWFTFIVNVWGEVFKIKENGVFTTSGKVISSIVIVVSVAVTLLNNWYASKSEHGELAKLDGKNKYLRKIMDSVDCICDEKYAQIRRIIQQVKDSNKSSPEIISNPENQLRRILEQIKSCLVMFMQTIDVEYSYNDFFVTLAYNFPEENNEWVWLDGTIERGMSLGELTDLSNKSTFNYLRTSKKPYYFNNKKEDAKKEDRYMYDTTDEANEANNRPVGSIFCYNFRVRQGNKTYVDAILSISTQQKRFADENNTEKIRNARDNMIALAKDYFGRRINIELGLLYLDYIERDTVKGNIGYNAKEVR